MEQSGVGCRGFVSFFKLHQPYDCCREFLTEASLDGGQHCLQTAGFVWDLLCGGWNFLWVVVFSGGNFGDIVNI